MNCSFLNVSHWIVELKTHTNTCSPKVILCGNKIDLQAQRKVDPSLAQKLCQEYNMSYVETSAFTGEGLDKAIEAIRSLIMSAIDGSVQSRRSSRLKSFSFAEAGDEWETTLAEWKHSRGGDTSNCCR